MEIALDIPEVLDYILLQAAPSAQAAAAETCQRWSDHALKWLWRRMDSFYPLLEILIPWTHEADSTDSTRWGRWEPASDLCNANWYRFDRYSAYIFSMDYDAYRLFRGQRALPSRHLLDQILIHRSNLMSSGSIFPNLAEVVWQTSDPSTFPYITLFLVPSVVSLEINCNGGNRLAHVCIEALELLEPRQIYLSFLELRMSSHDQTFLYKLSTVLASQTRLVRVGLPPYSATRQVVRALGRLPGLEEYFATFFDENQSVRDFGKEFDWELDKFPVLKRVTLYTSLADATSLMARPHQPRLNRFTLSSRETFLDSNVYDFCSTLSRNQSSITRLNLLIYPVPQSELTTGPPMSFGLFHPLLHCRGLTELRLESHLVLAYDCEDVGRMASAWPDMSTLSLCPDPDFHVDLDNGQPLPTVSAFTRSFAYLRKLGLYINTLDIDTPPNVPHAELAVLDLGTSVAPSDGSMSSVSEYLAKIIEPLGNLKAGRSVSHVRFLRLDDTDEYDTRVARWETIAANIGKIHESGKDRMRGRNPLGK